MTVWAVVFEVDGTLISTHEARAAAWSDACSEYGYERDLDFFWTRHDLNDRNVLHAISPNLSDESEVAKAINNRRLEIFWDHYRPAYRTDARRTRAARASP